MVDPLAGHPAFACFATNTKRPTQATCVHGPRRLVGLTARSGCSTLASDPEDRRGTAMEVVALSPLVALIAGILILIMPRLLNYIVAIYLILIGLLGLLGHYGA
jgi:Protein of unknown function (DUF3096)